MKVSLELFSTEMPFFNSHLKEVAEGVIDGWSNLTPEVQKLILWAGVRFDPIKGIQVQIQLEWEIVIEFSLVSKINQKHTFYIEGCEKIKSRTEELFKEVVLQSLKNISKGLQENAEDLRETLA